MFSTIEIFLGCLQFALYLLLPLHSGTEGVASMPLALGLDCPTRESLIDNS